MRGIFLLAIFIFLSATTLLAAHAGVLAWVWVALMYPHREVFGFAYDLRLNYYISILALLVWLASKEMKVPKEHRLLWLCAAFLAMTALSTFAAWDWDHSYPFFVEFAKTFALLYVVACTINSRMRIHAMVLVIVASLSYWGVKGGMFALTSGGGIILGPTKSQFMDNNQLALVLTTCLPLTWYLFNILEHKLTRIIIAGAGGLSAVAIFFSYSRGAFLAIAAMAAFWIITNRRFKALAAATLVGGGAFFLLPDSWFYRMDTISNYEEDRSAQGRFDAWQTSFNIAKADPLTGAGFTAVEIPEVYFKHNPNTVLSASKAAHSIWFQVMGDHGFVGFAIYVFLALSTWRSLGTIQKETRASPAGMVWISKLAPKMKMSLIGFWAGGSFLSMAYFDLYFLLIILTGTLSIIVENGGEEPSPVPRFASNR